MTKEFHQWVSDMENSIEDASTIKKAPVLCDNCKTELNNALHFCHTFYDEWGDEQ